MGKVIDFQAAKKRKEEEEKQSRLDKARKGLLAAAKKLEW